MDGFEKGDIITRVSPMHWFDQKTGGSFIDDRFIGKAVTYMGSMNGMIYGTYRNENGDIEMIAIELWKWDDEKWEPYIDPKTLFSDSLYSQLKAAELIEDYEGCTRIQKTINQNKGA